MLLVEHGKQYKNDVGLLRKLVREQQTLGAEAAEAMARAAAAEHMAKAKPEVKAEVAHEVKVKCDVD